MRNSTRLPGDGKHDHAEHIQTFRCQACHTTFSARRNTPLYRLKTPSQQIAVVLSALAEVLDPSAAERVFGFRQATITTWLSRVGQHAQTLHERFFLHLQLPHVQLDELRTRLRCAKQALWLWLAIDPLTKILPVLQLGPRTQHMAHSVIHSLRHILGPGCLPLFTSDGLNLYFYAITAHFGHGFTGSRRGRRVRLWQVAASLIYGQVKKCYRRRKLIRVAHVMRLGTEAAHGLLAGDGLLGAAEYRLHRASESDDAPWRLRAGTPHLGHSPAVSTAPGSSGVVASLLSFCASPRSTTSGTRATARTRRQPSGSTLSAADSRHGGRKNEPTMDDT